MSWIKEDKQKKNHHAKGRVKEKARHEMDRAYASMADNAGEQGLEGVELGPRLAAAAKEHDLRSSVSGQLSALREALMERDDIPPLPRDVWNLLYALVCGGRRWVWLAGGLHGPEHPKDDGELEMEPERRLIRLDLNGGGWQEMAPLPVPRWGGSLVRIDAEFLLLAGASRAQACRSGATQGSVYPRSVSELAPPLLYHEPTDTWREAELPRNIAPYSSVVVWRNRLVVSSEHGRDFAVDLKTKQEIAIPWRGVRLSRDDFYGTYRGKELPREAVLSRHMQATMVGESLLVVWGCSMNCHPHYQRTRTYTQVSERNSLHRCCCSLHLLDLEHWARHPELASWRRLPCPSVIGGHIAPDTAFFSEGSKLYLVGGTRGFDTSCCEWCATYVTTDDHLVLDLAAEELKWSLHYRAPPNYGTSFMQVVPIATGEKLLIGGFDFYGECVGEISVGDRVISNDLDYKCVLFQSLMETEMDDKAGN